MNLIYEKKIVKYFKNTLSIQGCIRAYHGPSSIVKGMGRNIPGLPRSYGIVKLIKVLNSKMKFKQNKHPLIQFQVEFYQWFS